MGFYLVVIASSANLLIEYCVARLDLIIGTKKRHGSGTGSKVPNGETKHASKIVMFKFNEFPLDLVLEVRVNVTH